MEQLSTIFKDRYEAYDWCYDNCVNISHRINRHGDMIISLKMNGETDHGKLSISVKQGNIEKAATLLYGEAVQAGIISDQDCYMDREEDSEKTE